MLKKNMVYEQVGRGGGGSLLKKKHGVREWDIRGDPLVKNMVYEQMGHKGGPFAQIKKRKQQKKTMV